MSDLSGEKIDEMIDLCEKMLERSYCIYSRFAVASVLLTDSGELFTGKCDLSSLYNINLELN